MEPTHTSRKKKRTFTEKLTGMSPTDALNNFFIDISVLSRNKICEYVSKVTNNDTIIGLKGEHLIVSNLNLKDLEIDLILGADVEGFIVKDSDTDQTETVSGTDFVVYGPLRVIISGRSVQVLQRLLVLITSKDILALW
ncbi:hypothetical protein CEXT_91971 [Caerostris extrusa]|uniref:Uncharacterized protein n=1 Tax=Caerostris extrusa TaxID=172846 RepID=A0AAV4SBY7_CAEEX|nr:hypothetical protein CEXT_91971 [Caerostris extrusa]